MFSKLAVIFAASMAVFVAAAPHGSSGGINNSCNSGPVQCCNSLYEHDAEEMSWIETLLGVEVPVNAFIGAQCSPITLVGTGSGASCHSQPVCCENNSFNGIIALGCSPVNINA